MIGKLIDDRLISLESKRIRLRNIKYSDSELFFERINHKEICLSAGIPYPYHKEYTNNFIESANEKIIEQSTFELGIEHKETGEIIGMCDLRNVSKKDKLAEIGYWVAIEFQGQGFAKEAVNTMLKFAFDVLELHRVVAEILIDNMPSIRVVENMGFQREAVLRENKLVENSFQDEYLYSILRHEFHDLG